MFSYIPAHAPGVFERYKVDGKPISWWETENPFFTYPKMLVSAAYGIEKSWTREKYVKNKDVKIFGDSGGFQIVTLGLSLTPLQVLRWLENNCDVGYTLDYSPFEKVEGSDKVVKNIISMDKFKVNLEKTKANNKIYEKYRQNKNLKIYNVIHGHNKERLEMWYNAMKDFKFEGWAVGSQPPYGDPMKQVIGSLFLYDKGVRENLHVFAVSGMNVIPALVYLGKHIKNYTADSSSYAIGRMYCSFMSPYKLGYYVPMGRRGVETRVKKLPCTCEVCSYLNNHNNGKYDFYDKMRGMEQNLVTLHNLNMFIKYIEILNTMVENKQAYRDFLKAHITDCPRLFDALDFIDTVIEKGFDYGYHKYQSKLQFQECPTNKKLFEF